MKLTVQRIWETPRSICGTLSIDGTQFCYTLEPARENPVIPGHPCIPAGTYDLALTFSPHFQMTTPEVLDVPGRSEIRIHPGNKPSDSEGCTLVGASHVTDWVSNSRSTFDTLLERLQASPDPITIEYIDVT